jgi:hypothetical protein
MFSDKCYEYVPTDAVKMPFHYDRLHERPQSRALFFNITSVVFLSSASLKIFNITSVVFYHQLV